MSNPVDLSQLDPATRQAFEQLLSYLLPIGPQHLSAWIPRLVSGGTVRKINFGTGTLSPSATTVATSANIAHGLDSTPTYVFVTGEAPSGFGAGLGWNIVKSSVTSTNLKVQMNASVAVTDTLRYWWIAVS